MSSVDVTQQDQFEFHRSAIGKRQSSATSWFWTILEGLASLKLTVVLFAFSLCLVLIGTFAQVEQDIWEVMRDYFRTWITLVPLKVVFPSSFFAESIFGWIRSQPIVFPFPGGATIGTGLLVNLLAAHSIRFKIQAKNSRLLAGLLVMGIAAAMTWLIVSAGHNPDGLQGQPIEGLWGLLKVILVLATAFNVIAAFRHQESRTIRIGLTVSAAALVVLLGWLMWSGDTFQPGTSSLRILWQLLQSGFVAVIACAGAFLLFKKRAGIVTLHLGVLLLMLSELFVTLNAVEERMQIGEGETTNFASDIRSVELAVIQPDFPNRVTVVPGSKLVTQQGSYPRISHPDLPFDLQVKEYFKNSKVVMRGSEEERKLAPDSLAAADLATAGDGLRMRAANSRAASGVSSSPVDQASYYVEFFRPNSDESLGVFLLSQAPAMDGKTPPIHWQAPDRATIPTAATSGVEVSLRFKRSYKPYSIHLVDVRKDDYLGTDTPRNYSSDVRLLDPSRNVDREIRIWMNNPLRYAGETFYQSGYQPGFGGRDITDLQLVTNTGWMIPYVACMYVAVGLLFHFSETLVRFLRRMESAPKVATATSAIEPTTSRQQRRREGRRNADAQPVRAGAWARWLPADWTGVDWCFVLVPLVLLFIWLQSAMSPRTFVHNGMNLDAFGRLPIAYQGRTEPLDTLARNTMLVISNRETVDVDKDNKGLPAILWLADLASGKVNKEGERSADQYQIVRIENPDVAEILGLPRRERFRYAISEFRDKLDKFSAEVKKVRERDSNQLSTSERKVLELDNRLRTYMRLQFAFQPLPFPALPTREDLATNRDEAMQRLQRIKELMERAPDYNRELLAMQPPLAVPNDDQSDAAKDERWQPYAVADYLAFVAPIFDKKPNPAAIHWNKILTAYANNEPEAFNLAVKEYQETLELGNAAELNPSKIRFEAFYNAFRPFNQALVMYLVIFILSALSWLGYRRYLSRSALTVLAIVFLVHSFAICGRIYISGRPPVTNLYSSAVFIGWGSVLFCILLESIYRLGVGTVVASVAGYSTLLIANGLAAEGDTFPVLQAVLDTQFWLSTHVTCITFGYATTLLAGLLGTVYLLGRAVTGKFDPRLEHALPRMTYGILCFSIFFTFIGTVLGGLWADDSWGRFWGWDPKENGALMIVLWNALVLHARWGKMVGPRGLATLCVLGNIVVTWSWFGTNQLGIGLHAYGFQDGMVRNLWIFWATQSAIATLGFISYLRFPRQSSSATVDPQRHIVLPT